MIWAGRKKHKLQDRSLTEITKSEEYGREKNEEKNEQSIREIWDTINTLNIYIMGIPWREKRKKELKNILIKRLNK